MVELNSVNFLLEPPCLVLFLSHSSWAKFPQAARYAHSQARVVLVFQHSYSKADLFMHDVASKIEDHSCLNICPLPKVTLFYLDQVPDPTCHRSADANKSKESKFTAF